MKNSVRHTSSAMKIEQMIASIERGLESFFRDEVTFRRWVGKSVYERDVERLLKKTIAYVDDEKREPEERFNQRLYGEIMERYESEPNTIWGVYNALTNWATHFESRGAAHNVTRDRHNRVAKLMRSEQWLQMSS